MYRNDKLRRAIASLPCVECGLEGSTQAAHANTPPFGKGKGIKAHDWAEFPLCFKHHEQHDQYMNGLSKSERIDHEAMLIARTFGMLMEHGLLEVKR